MRRFSYGWVIAGCAMLASRWFVEKRGLAIGITVVDIVRTSLQGIHAPMVGTWIRVARKSACGAPTSSPW